MAETPKPEDWILPAYRVSLSKDQAFLLGHFTAVWGQIDFLMGLCISALLKVDFFAAETLMQSMTTGPRLNLFQKLIKESLLKEPEKRLGRDLSRDMSSLIEKRNHIMNGMWGEILKDGKSIGSGAHYTKTPKHLMADELPALIVAASKQTHRLATLATHLTDLRWEYTPSNPPVMFFVAHPEPPPKSP